MPRLHLSALALSLLVPAAAADVDTEDPVERLVRAALDPAAMVLGDVALPEGLPQTCELVIDGPGGPRTLLLRKSSQRGPGYRLMAQVEGGELVEVPAPAVRTYRGTLLEVPGAQVAASLGEDGLTAAVLGPDGDWFVVPLGTVDERLAGAGHVAYVPGASAFGEHRCGADMLPAGEDVQTGSVASMALGGSGCITVAEMAFDADHEYYLSAGSSTAQVAVDIDASLNVANVMYERDVQIRHEVTTVIVRTDVNDPYTSNGAHDRRLEFHYHWYLNHQDVTRALAHLITGLDLEGDDVGSASRGTVCTTAANALSQWTFSFETNTFILAHEVAHNWGATFCLDLSCGVMCGGCLSIGPMTQTVIMDHRDSRTCLTSGPGSVTDLPPTARADSAVASGPTRIDVLANDSDGNCDPLTIVAHETTSLLGGTVELLAGLGEHGGGLLRYTALAGTMGTDVFLYTVGDGNGNQDTSSVLVYLQDGDPQLVARYALDEAGGPTCHDSSGNGLHGEYFPTVLFGRPGALPGTGTSVELDGQHDRAWIPNGPLLDGLSTDLTVAAWVQPHGGVGIEGVFGNNWSWAFGLSSSGLVFTTRDVRDYIVSATVPQHAWSHVAAVMDPGHDVHFYVNGEHVGSVPGTEGASPPHTLWHLGGSSTSSFQEYLDGGLDDVQVYGDALSGEQVRWLYQNPGEVLGGAALGQSFCFGDGSGGACPCGNASVTPGEGCVHSGGDGMLISASGSASVAADDLMITVRNAPPFNGGIYYSGKAAFPAGSPLFDGLQCVGGNVRRYRGLFQTSGTVSDTGFVAQDPSSVYFVPGTTYHYQYWTRDVAAGPTPCGTGANFSPGIAVTATP